MTLKWIFNGIFMRMCGWIHVALDKVRSAHPVKRVKNLRVS